MIAVVVVLNVVVEEALEVVEGSKLGGGRHGGDRGRRAGGRRNARVERQLTAEPGA